MVRKMIHRPLMSHEARTQEMTMSRRPIEILLVEDDLGDIDLMMEAFECCPFPVNIKTLRDGISAIAYLCREGEYANATLPDLILLDLNLPRKGGQEVLKDIKSDDNLKHIPVIVLTTSDTEEDILKAYNSGANCYLSKPLGLEEYLQVVKSIEDFWFTAVKLPTRTYR